MSKEKDLLKLLPKLIEATQADKIKWEVSVKTDEFSRENKKETVEGKEWDVSEVFVSYDCEFGGEDFNLITYEKILSDQLEKKTINLIFQPPLYDRAFELDTLAKHALTNDKMLSYEVHMLWLSILELKKKGSKNLLFDVNE